MGIPGGLSGKILAAVHLLLFLDISLEEFLDSLRFSVTRQLSVSCHAGSIPISAVGTFNLECFSKMVSVSFLDSLEEFLEFSILCLSHK